MIPSISTASNSIPAAQPAQDEAELWQVAQDLEASFLAEMLKHAGFGEARKSNGGGAGEEQFASMMRNEHARAMAENGGIGLGEAIFQSLLARAESSGALEP